VERVDPIYEWMFDMLKKQELEMKAHFGKARTSSLSFSITFCKF
jgi:hypothetical protein